MSSTCYQNLTLVGLLAGALGTWALAALAIWGSVIKSKLWPPVLILEKHNYSGDFNKASNGDERIYYHLKLYNTSKFTEAEKARVLLKGISRQCADKNSFYIEPLSIPMQLTWSFTAQQEFFPTIGPEVFIDIGYLSKTENMFIPSLYLFPGNFKGFLKPNETLRYELVVVANNYKNPSPFYLEVSWDGQFDFGNRDEMKRHIVIKEVKALT